MKQNYMHLAIKGAAALFIAGILSSVFSYVLRLVLARNLSTQEFGLVYSLLALFGIINILVNLGLGQAMVNEVSRYVVKKKMGKVKEVIRTVAKLQFSISIVFGIFVFLGANWLSKNYFGVEEALLPLRFLAFAIILGPIDIIASSLFKAYKRLEYVAFINFFKVFFITISTSIFLAFGLSVIGAILPYVLVYIFWFTLGLYAFRKTFDYWKENREPIKHIEKSLFLFGLPVIFSGFSEAIITHIDIFLLTILRSLDEVGLYNVAIPIASLIMIFGHTIAATLFPFVSELWHSKKMGVISGGLKLLYKYSFIFALPVLVVLIAFTDTAIIILFGDQYVSAAFAAQILIIGGLFQILSAINNTALTGLEKPKIFAKITIIGAVSNVLINILLIPFFGLVGAAIATSASFLFMAIWGFIEINKMVKITFPYTSWLKVSILALIVLLVVSFAKTLSTNIYVSAIISLTIAGILYIFGLFLLKVITISEIKDMYARIRNR